MDAASEERIRAAEYVRMSTDHQRYSIENQQLEIRRYAAERGMQIVRTFDDAGKSGLTMDERDGLQALLGQVIAGNADFEVLLVYDISRWGRFQDADEAAHYEFLCRRHGVRVVYCAEPFENDGSPLSAIYKGIKRAMAGEYSRELSIKTAAGKRRLATQGFHPCGPPGMGLRRMLVDGAGKHVRILDRGDWKSPLVGRVILVPGPPEEVALVNRIYDLFIDQRLSCMAIAQILNADGEKTDFGRRWSHHTVRQVLSNEKYIGTLVYGRTSEKLRSRKYRVPSTHWVRVEGAFEAIVDAERFEKARAILAEWSLPKEEMLNRLRAVYERRGKLSAKILVAETDVPSPSAYRAKFGSLFTAYRLIGYRPPPGDTTGVANRMQRKANGLTLSSQDAAAREAGTERPRRAGLRTHPNKPQRINQPETYLTDQDLIDRLRALYERTGKLSARIINEAEGLPNYHAYYQRFGSLFTAYRRAGYEPPEHEIRLVAVRRVTQLRRIEEALLRVSAPPGLDSVSVESPSADNRRERMPS